MMHILLTTLLTCMMMSNGDTVTITTGNVRRTIQNAALKQDSRIAYAYYPSYTGMPLYQRKINEAISVAVPFRLGDEESPIASQNLSEQFFTNALHDLAKRYSDYITSTSDVNEAPWVLIDSTMIDDQVLLLGKQTDLVQVVRYRYEFAGGAHGNSFITIALFSKTTGKQLAFAKDIVTDLAGFKKVAEAAFRKARKIPGKRSFTKAGYWFEQGFGLSENVLLSNDTVTLIYNPYECAPYVMGEIRVSIPMSEVESLLKIRSR
ncbi:MAG: RsiV family protein [Ignavibacteria bacterium]|jgi:hypothetical protein